MRKGTTLHIFILTRISKTIAAMNFKPGINILPSSCCSMHPYALIILVHMWNCECFAGMEANISVDCSRWVDVRQDDVVPNARIQ